MSIHHLPCTIFLVCFTSRCKKEKAQCLVALSVLLVIPVLDENNYFKQKLNIIQCAILQTVLESYRVWNWQVDVVSCHQDIFCIISHTLQSFTNSCGINYSQVPDKKETSHQDKTALMSHISSRDNFFSSHNQSNYSSFFFFKMAHFHCLCSQTYH